MKKGYDIIGDIHGHADSLTALLQRLGYEQTNGVWCHPERKVIFLGDFVDIDPKQVETVMIAKGMVEAGSALVVMGNHELNAIAWYLPDPDTPGEFLRPHFTEKWGKKNRLQHSAFLQEVEDKPELHGEIIDWFLTLPLWLELEQIQVVHACWNSSVMRFLQPYMFSENRLTKELMPEATREPVNEEEKDSPGLSIFKAVEMLTKGLEIALPPGYRFTDNYGIERKRVRVRWWDTGATKYRTAAMVEEQLRQQLPDIQIPSVARVRFPTDKPIFIGHYWRTGEPAILSPEVVCVDYSAGKGGPLCAFRWDEGIQIDDTGFCHL